eukprot:135348_1
MRSLQDTLTDYDITIDTSAFPCAQFRYPMVGIILYIITTHYFQPPLKTSSKKETSKTAADTKKRKKKPITTAKLFMFAHNVLLCVFSGLCCYSTFPIILDIFLNG